MPKNSQHAICNPSAPRWAAKPMGCAAIPANITRSFRGLECKIKEDGLWKVGTGRLTNVWILVDPYANPRLVTNFYFYFFYNKIRCPFAGRPRLPALFPFHCFCFL